MFGKLKISFNFFYPSDDAKEFITLFPSDVPAGLASEINCGSFRGRASPHDVVCMIKRHIQDDTLAQPPLLVLTQGRGENFVLVPTQKIPVSTSVMGQARKIFQNVFGKLFVYWKEYLTFLL